MQLAKPFSFNISSFLGKIALTHVCSLATLYAYGQTKFLFNSATVKKYDICKSVLKVLFEIVSDLYMEYEIYAMFTEFVRSFWWKTWLIIETNGALNEHYHLID